MPLLIDCAVDPEIQPILSEVSERIVGALVDRAGAGDVSESESPQ
ncbi:MAG: hypothetical protein WBQ37_12775 [Candidatus Competibacter sp.]